MGNDFKKDDQLDLYMELSKQAYVAGEYVEGCVYIDARVRRAYSALRIKLVGNEKVEWQEHRKKKTVTLKNSCKNYEDSFLMTDFHGAVNQGQYSLPFSFLLPSAMAGSLIMD